MGQKHPKIKQDTLTELLNQTSFSETEILEWYKGYLKEFSNGHLSLDDFKQSCSRFCFRGDSTQFSESIFRILDRNHDGFVDFCDFISLINVTHRGNLLQKLELAFFMYDLDNDGYISRQELCEVISSIYCMVDSNFSLCDDKPNAEEQSDKILELMDLDKDGRLSLDEFIQGVQSNRIIMHLVNEMDTQPLSCCDRECTQLKEQLNSPIANKTQSEVGKK